MPKTINGGQIHNNEVSLNTGQGDHLPCTYCHQEIPLIKSRENRVDCEGDTLESYHLACYDVLMFGRVTTLTIRKLKKLAV